MTSAQFWDFWTPPPCHCHTHTTYQYSPLLLWYPRPLPHQRRTLYVDGLEANLLFRISKNCFLVVCISTARKNGLLNEISIPPSLLNPSRAISENDLRIYSTASSSSNEEEEEEEGDLDREGCYSKKAGPPEKEGGRREESVEVNTEDEQSSRWETDNRLHQSIFTYGVRFGKDYFVIYFIYEDDSKYDKVSAVIDSASQFHFT